METVRSKTEAEALKKKYAHHGDHRTVPGVDGVAAPTGAGASGVQAEDADGIDLDPDAIAAAEKQLGDLYFELAAQLEQAKRLEGKLHDGSSPVALPMGKSFNLRAGAAEGGVQATLQAYLAELNDLRAAIGQARAAHQTFNADAAASLRTTATEQAG